MVISYRFCTREHLGSDASIIGKSLRINGYPSTVIGVGPKEFLGASPSLFVADLWLPVSVDAHLAPELADNALERNDRCRFSWSGRSSTNTRSPESGSRRRKAYAVAQAIGQQSYGEGG